MAYDKGHYVVSKCFRASHGIYQDILVVCIVKPCWCILVIIMVLPCLYLEIKFHLVWVTVLLMYPVTYRILPNVLGFLFMYPERALYSVFVFKLPIFSVYVPLFHYTSCPIGICTHPIIIWYCNIICTCCHTALHRYLLLVLCACFAGYDTYWCRSWLSLKYFKVTEYKGQLPYATHKAAKNCNRKPGKPLMMNQTVWNKSGILYQTTTNLESEQPPPSPFLSHHNVVYPISVDTSVAINHNKFY